MRGMCKSFEEYEAELEGKLSRRPLCSQCYEPIQEDTAYVFDGELWCEHCVKEHMVTVEDMEDDRE